MFIIINIYIYINNNNLKFSMYLVVVFECSIAKFHTLHPIAYPLSLHR